MQAKLILAGMDEGRLLREAYPAFAAAGFEVLAVVDAPDMLRDAVAAAVQVADDRTVLVVEADLVPTPEEAVALLSGLGDVCLTVVLPPAWMQHLQRFASLDLVATFCAPVAWPDVAARVAQRLASRVPVARATAEGELDPATEQGQPVTETHGDVIAHPTTGGVGRRVCALWSGPAGGTGRSMLSLSLGLLAAERALNAVVMALSGPAIPAYLHLPRVPNVSTFFETGNLSQAEQTVGWERADGETDVLSVLLGPARARDGAVEQAEIGALVEATQAAHDLVIMDLPALVPGGNAWGLVPLQCASDVLLVMVPTVAGVAATIDALTVLRDIRAPGRVHLLLNRSSAGGFSVRAFSAGVAQVWGECPPFVAALDSLPGLAGRLNRGELPDVVLGESALAQVVRAMGSAVAGLPDAGRAGGTGGRVAAESGEVSRRRRPLVSWEEAF